MAGNGAGSSSRGDGASISAAAAAVGSADDRFAVQERVFPHIYCAFCAILDAVSGSSRFIGNNYALPLDL